MYALTSSFDGRTRAIVGNDQRFEFPAEDGGLLADMLADEFPECEICESRWDVCTDCHGCRECGTCDCERDPPEPLRAGGAEAPRTT